MQFYEVNLSIKCVLKENKFFRFEIIFKMAVGSAHAQYIYLISLATLRRVTLIAQFRSRDAPRLFAHKLPVASGARVANREVTTFTAHCVNAPALHFARDVLRANASVCLSHSII